VSPISPIEAIERGVTLDRQIAWLDAWGWRWSDVSCEVSTPATSTTGALEVSCDVSARTKLGEVDDASIGDGVVVRSLDGVITFADWGVDLPASVPAFAAFERWAESERPELWRQAWNDAGPLLDDESIEIEAQLLDEYIAALDSGDTSTDVDAASAGPSIVELAVVDPTVIDPTTDLSGVSVLPWNGGFLVITGPGNAFDPNATTRFHAASTIDGSLAATFEFELPLVPFFIATESRIAAFGWDTGPNGASQFTVSTTTDLIDWQTSVVDLGGNGRIRDQRCSGGGRHD
jgi:hypothetical protein